MKNKTLSFVLASLLSFVFLISFASAISFADTTPTVTQSATTVNHDAGSFTVTATLSNTGTAGTVALSSATTAGTITSVAFNPTTGFSMADGSTTPTSQTVTATVTFPAGQTGTISGTITADPTPSSATDATIPFSVTINSESEVTLSKTADITRSQNGTLKVTNSGNQVLSNIALTASGTIPVTLSSTSLSTLTVGGESSITVTPTDLSALKFGSNSVTVTAAGTGLTSKTQAFTFTKTFCEAGSVGSNLTIKDVSINNVDGDDEEWNLLDDIEVEVEVENSGSTKIKDVFVELALFDSNGVDIADDLDFSNSDDEKIDLGSISDDKEKTAEFKFNIPGDIADDNYKLAVKAYSKDLGETVACDDNANDLSDSTFEAVSIERKSDSGELIDYDDIVISPSDATCGDTVSLAFDVVNVGDEEQDRVEVNVRSSDLGVDLSREITKDLDEGDDQRVEFTFKIPADAKNQPHILEIFSRYGYDNGVYDDASDDTKRVPLTVFGCTENLGTVTGSSSGIAIAGASLSGDAVAGEETTVAVTISNTASTDRVFTLDTRGLSSWADFESFSESAFILPAGQSKTVEVTITPEKDVEGKESFTLEVTSSDGKVSEREIEIDFGEHAHSSGFGNNSLIWVIGIVNLVLILLIILVAVRVSRA